MGVVAVYALNDEFKTIKRETKNGMVGPLSYVLSKFFLVIPLMFVFAVFALGIPSIAIMDFPGSSFGMMILLWGICMYVFECVAECLSVWFDDPIIGMLQFMNFWFGKSTKQWDESVSSLYLTTHHSNNCRMFLVRGLSHSTT